MTGTYTERMAEFVTSCRASDIPPDVRERAAVLHELAHAYHDQVLGFDDRRIQEAYESFKQSGHGESVLLFDGTHTRHYALTDQKEFFAEFTEAYFGLNDFYPFNRAELKTAEPAIYDLMVSIWGPIQSGNHSFD